VQKPFAFSLQVPVPMLAFPRSTDFCAGPFVTGARGSRVIFPSGVKVILNLRPDGVLAVKAWPVKKVAWIARRQGVCTKNDACRDESYWKSKPTKARHGEVPLRTSRR
jgi:hypothetical protein